MKTSKKLVACIVMVLTLCMMFTACGTPVNNIVSAVDGVAEGKIGTTLRTCFFDYSIDSVSYPSEYEGYTASEGMQLVDVVITIENTFGEKLPMFNSDFLIEWGDGEDDWDWGVTMANSSTVMPDEYELAAGATCNYHVIFEVPADAKEFDVAFLEIFDNDSTGDVFFTYFTKK